MELLNLDPRKKANEGAFLHLKHPGNGSYLFDDGDESKPVGLYLLGKDSDKYETIRHQNTNTRLSEKKSPLLTSEKIEQDAISLLADLTVGWDNLTVDGDTVYSRENVVKLYKKLPWVKEQVDVFVVDRANFI